MGFYYIIQIWWCGEDDKMFWETEEIFMSMMDALIKLKHLREKHPQETYRLHKEMMGADK